jgi:hypothetical protein
METFGHSFQTFLKMYHLTGSNKPGEIVTLGHISFSFESVALIY